MGYFFSYILFYHNHTAIFIVYSPEKFEIEANIIATQANS